MSDLTTQDDPVEPTDSPKMEDTIAQEWERISQGVEITEGVADETPDKPAIVRDQAGRFAGKAPVEPVEAAPVGQAYEQPVSTKRPPSSWKKEAVAEWGKLPPHVQDEVLRREDNFHARLKNTETYDAIDSALAPYQQTIQSLGATPAQVVGEMLKVDNIVRNGSNEQVLSLIAEVMQRRQIPLDVFAQGISPQVFQTAQQHNEMEQLRLRMQQMEAQKETESLNALNSEIARFSEGKEHWDAVQYELEAILRQIASDPQKFHLSPQEKLQEAYDRAVWANPQAREALIAKQQAEARAKAQEKLKNAKQAASVNVKSRGALPAAQPVGSMEDTIRAKAAELGFIN